MELAANHCRAQESAHSKPPPPPGPTKKKREKEKLWGFVSVTEKTGFQEIYWQSCPKAECWQMTEVEDSSKRRKLIYIYWTKIGMTTNQKPHQSWKTTTKFSPDPIYNWSTKWRNTNHALSNFSIHIKTSDIATEFII